MRHVREVSSKRGWFDVWHYSSTRARVEGKPISCEFLSYRGKSTSSSWRFQTKSDDKGTMDSKVLLLIWRRWWKNHLALRDEGWTVEWNTNDPYGFVLVIKDVCDAVWIDNKRSTRRIFYSNPFSSNGLHLCYIWYRDFCFMCCFCCFWTLKRQLEKKRQFFFYML